MARSDRDRRLSLPRVTAALIAIAMLAFAAPYAIVRGFHQRRLAVADAQLAALAASVANAVGPMVAAMPAATELLAGRGARPRPTDDRWGTARAFPLHRVVSDPGPDPWGNAYLVRLGDRGRIQVISAGPDGILQTAFASAPDRLLGDDRAVTAARR
jgi:hypothetical protein